MSEEILKRKYDKAGDPLGDWEFFTIGETNLNALKKFGIIPKKDYGAFASNKPDELVVDRRGVDPDVLLVVEYKKPKEFDTEKKRQAAIKQCVDNYCHPLNARIGLVTDTVEYIWINPRISNDASFDVALREDGYPLDFVFDPRTDPIKSAHYVSKCLESFSDSNSQLKKPEIRNPSNLADRVWQKIWLASGENPDICLATFVEVFLFKYLSDLGVLTTNDDGVDISFDATLGIKEDRVFNFYHKNVRPHIKSLFPTNPQDDTSVINGIVLDPDVVEHNFIFKELLEEFRKFGELKNIDPEFKSRLYENFLKKSISQKNWGQYFTPRNIVKAMIEMSGLRNLAAGAVVCDPACGVGGFLLESINTVRPNDYKFEKDEIRRAVKYIGFDRDKKTITLAKSNMLIHLNELLQENPKFPQAFANVFNKTFVSKHGSILGALSEIEHDKYDLILTNPPYVVTGTSTIKKYISDDSELSSYYYVNGAGVEGLFLEKVVRSLKPGGKAFVVVPDGIMNRLSDSKLRAFILSECYLACVISLPKNAFYTTPKKTYILGLIRKTSISETQSDPVFTYLVTRTGETLDSHRFVDENDLPQAVKMFKVFGATPSEYDPNDLKCKVWPIEAFNPEEHWSIDRWWSAQERIELGIDEDKTLTDPDDFTEILDKHAELVESSKERLQSVERTLPEIENFVEIELSNESYFHLFIGKRVLKKDLYKSNGQVPVYSANVREPFGWMQDSNIADFSKPYVLWGIDGNFEFSVQMPGEVFRTTDHCGAIRIEDDQINPLYVYYVLHAVREENRLDRELRANLQNIKKKFVIRIPIVLNEDGTPKTKNGSVLKDGTVEKLYVFDEDLQKNIVEYYTEFEEIKAEVMESAAHIAALEMETIRSR